MIDKSINIFRELSRRKVIRATTGYIFVYWVLALGAADLFPAFGLSDSAVRAFVLAGFVGLPFVILLSWKYDLTAQGLVRDSLPSDGAHLTASAVRDWCLQRQGPGAPSTFVGNWQDARLNIHNQHFTTNIVVGRDEQSDICIADQRVSRLHAVIWFQSDNWFLRDLGSTNGTWMNGERVDKIMLLEPRGAIRFHEEGPVLNFEITNEDDTVFTLQK